MAAWLSKIVLVTGIWTAYVVLGSAGLGAFEGVMAAIHKHGLCRYLLNRQTVEISTRMSHWPYRSMDYTAHILLVTPGCQQSLSPEPLVVLPHGPCNLGYMLDHSICIVYAMCRIFGPEVIKQSLGRPRPRIRQLFEGTCEASVHFRFRVITGYFEVRSSIVRL